MTGRVITVAQQKGGAGKTTLAAHLAVAWAQAGRSVALLDIDPQGSLSAWMARRAARSDGALLLTHSQIPGWRTQREVERLAAQHDLVLIDSPPHAETEGRIAVRAADLVLIPVQPSPIDLWATRPTLDLCAGERVPMLIVLNRVPPRTKLTEAVIREVEDLGAPVACNRLGNRTAYAASLVEGSAATESGRRTVAAEEVAALAEEIAAHLDEGGLSKRSTR